MRADIELRNRLLGEVRAPKAANLKLSYSGPGQRQVAEWDASTAIKVAYYQNVIAARCVQIIAEDIASLPLRAGKSEEKPKDFNSKARIMDFIGPEGNPNPNSDAHELLVWSIINFLLTGRYGWELELTNNRAKDIIAIWPLVPIYLQPIETEDTSNYWAGYEYIHGSDTRKLTLDQVFYHWRPSQHDWRQPESVLQSARYDLSVAIMQDRYDYNFLLNDARPSSVGIVERFAKREEYESFKRQFQGQYGGTDNAGRIAWMEADPDPSGSGQPLSGMWDIKTLGLSQKDAEFIQRHEQKMRNVAIGIGVPWSRLDASQRTYENADVEDRNYWKSTVQPLAKRFKSAFNRNLAPRLGSEKVWFDYSGIESLKETHKFQNTRITDLYNSGILKLDEAREAVDEEPLPNGEGDKLIPVPIAPVPQGLTNSSPVTKAKKIRLKPVAKEKRVPIDHHARRRKIWAKTDSQVRALETQWKTSMEKMFAKQRKATLARLTGKRGRQLEKRDDPSASDIYDSEYWQGETEDFVSNLYESVSVVAGTRVADAFNTTFDLGAGYVKDFIAKRSNTLAGFVTDTTYKQIQDAMTAGASAGESIPDIADRITAVFDQAEGVRAETIARTEVISAYNGSATEVASNLGSDIVAQKEWIATDDERTRDAHSEADGQMVGMDEPFDVDDEELMYPGDPDGSDENVVNCRCTVAFSDGSEMTNMGDYSKPQKRMKLEEAEKMIIKAALEAA